MLEDVKNSLPDQLSNRFDLNRFFAATRDIINDELQDNVPFLIEDALENPTGTYKQISRFQNEKLMDIDRSNIRIEQKLDDILGLIGKSSKGDGGGDSIWDDLLGLLGGGLLDGLGGWGGRKKGPKGKSPKTKKPKGRGPKTKKGKFKLPKITGRGAAMAALAAIGGTILYDAFNDDFSTEDLMNGEYNDILGEVGTDLGVYGAIGAAPTVANKITNMISGPSKVPPVPTATPKGEAVMRRDLPKDHPKYKAPGGKMDEFGNSASKVSAEEATNYKPTTATPKAPPAKPGFFSKMGSYLKSSTSGAIDYAKSSIRSLKSTAYIAAAFACWDFYNAVSALPADMSEEEYRKEVGRLARETVAITGLTMFGAFAGSLVAGMAGSFVPGIGNAVGVALGFLGGMVGGSLADYFVGDEVRGAVNNAALAAIVDTLVGWIMAGVKAVKSVMPDQKKQNNKLARSAATDEFANLNDEQLQAKGLKRLPKRVNPKAGVTSTLNEYEVVDPEKYKPSASPAPPSGAPTVTPPTATPKSDTPATVPTEEPKPEDQTSSLDWMAPSAMMGSMLGSMGGKEGGELMAAMAGIGGNKELQAEMAKHANLLSPAGIFGAEGMSAMMGMVGAKNISPESAVAMGLVSPDATEAEIKAKVDEFNSYIKPQKAADSRVITPELPKADIAENINKTMTEQMTQLSEAMASGTRQTVAQPSITIKGFPQAAATPHPTSLAVVALRAQGMADVYAHPQSGATMQRMDRGGETLLG